MIEEFGSIGGIVGSIGGVAAFLVALRELRKDDRERIEQISRAQFNELCSERSHDQDAEIRGFANQTTDRIDRLGGEIGDVRREIGDVRQELGRITGMMERSPAFNGKFKDAVQESVEFTARDLFKEILLSQRGKYGKSDDKL